MLLNSYQAQAMRFLNKDVCGNHKEMRTNAALGLCGESGEFADIVKKILFQGHPDDEHAHHRMVLELGDALWYCAEGAEALEVDLSYIAQTNINKLMRLYSKGFTTAASLNRSTP